MAQLVAERTEEDAELEFKETLNLNKDSDKKDFLRQVASFANAAGGLLVFGVKEIDGKANEIVGIEVDCADALRQRILSIVAGGTDLPVPGVNVRFIPVNGSAQVVIVGIPRSWISPHMVKDDRGFWVRHPGGKHYLGTTELRHAFLLSETRTERIRRFRDGRLARILAGETPVRVADSARIVLHVVPLAFADASHSVSLSPVAENPSAIPPIQGLHWLRQHFNFDGFLLGSGYAPSPVVNYVQFFRSGALEYVEGCREIPSQHEPVGCLGLSMAERGVHEALRALTPVLYTLGESPPLVIMTALVGAKGGRVEIGDFLADSQHEMVIDRDALVPSEGLIENREDDLDVALRPMFDAFWNAAGWDRSPNFDAAGKWMPSRR
jgi:hypothetical protein